MHLSFEYAPCSPLHRRRHGVVTKHMDPTRTCPRTWLPAPTFDRDIGNYNPCDHAGHSRSHQGDAPGHGEASIIESLSCGAEQSQVTADALSRESVLSNAHLGASYATNKLLAAAILRRLSYLVRRVVMGPYPWRYLKIVSCAVLRHGCYAGSRGLVNLLSSVPQKLCNA
jgi:hypothetical protein